MKKSICLLLALALCLGIFAGCGNKKQEPETPKVEDDGIMKILLIGHSTGMDSAYMLPAIAKNEGVEKLVVGMLYHSGCRLAQHVEYLQNDAAQYAYYEFDIETQDAWLRADKDGNFLLCEPYAANDIYINDGSIGQTMKFGIQRHDWDIIVQQGGVLETTNNVDGAYSPNITADIQTIRDYVEKNDIEPATKPKYAWNMIWEYPTDSSLWRDSDRVSMNELFGGDALNQRQAIADTTRDIVKPEETFTWFMPSAASLWNAEKAGMTPKELRRDYVHGSDFTRMMVGYLWYCVLFNKNIDDCNLNPIPGKLVFEALKYNTNTPLELTDAQKTILKDSVKKALANPYDTCK